MTDIREQAAVLGGNAARFYGLDAPGRGPGE